MSLIFILGYHVLTPPCFLNKKKFKIFNLVEITKIARFVAFLEAYKVDGQSLINFFRKILINGWQLTVDRHYTFIPPAE